MAREDLISIVEAAYRSEASEEEWIQGVAAAVASTIGRGLGACAFFLDASDRSHLAVDLDPESFLATAQAVAPDSAAQTVGTRSTQLGVEAWKASRPYNE